MRVASVALLVVNAAHLSAAFWKSRQLWQRRKCPIIRARYPGLLLCSVAGQSAFTYVVSAECICRMEGIPFSCDLIIFSSFLGIALSGVPALMRALKMMIAMAEQETRRKYAFILAPFWAWKQVAGGFVQNTVMASLVAWFRPFQSGSDYYCYVLQPWQLQIVLMVIMAAFAAYWCRRIVQANDLLRIGEEVACEVIGVIGHAGIYFFVLVVQETTHAWKVSTALNLVFASQAFAISLAKLYWWGCLRWVRDPIARRAYLEVKTEPSFGAPNRKSGRHVVPLSSLTDASHSAGDGIGAEVAEIMAHPVLDRLFYDFIRRALCLESYDFLRAVEGYDALVRREQQRAEGGGRQQEEGQAAPQAAQQGGEGGDGGSEEGPPAPLLEQVYECYTSICRTYIEQFSDMEVNIDTKMRTQGLRLMNRDVFMSADHAEARASVFHPSVLEVRHMLQGNFLAKFRESKAYLEAREAEQAAAAREEEKEATKDDHNALDDLNKAITTMSSPERGVSSFGFPNSSVMSSLF